MAQTTPLAPAQEDRLKRFKCARTVDVHCHVLPGIDDGPQNAAEAINLCRAMVADGITDVIATPHQLGRWDGANHPLEIRAAVTELQKRLNAAEVPLTIHPGAEVRLDERIPQLLGSGKVLTLADRGVYLLLELPLGLNVDPAFLMPYLTSTGAKIVLAHPERYEELTGDPNVVQQWISQGVLLQVNAQCLVGRDETADVAWEWLAQGWVSVVATDAHSINARRPRMSDAIEQIARRLGEDVARRVCIENPARVLDGQELLGG